MITVKDVASRAGVSASTVSRALSGNIPVSEATKERVLKAVAELKYKPNVLAKGLKERRTKLLALVIPDITNPLFPALARGTEDMARSLGYNVIVCNTDEDLEIEKEFIRDMANSWIDGFIFATASEKSTHLLELHESGTPMVLLVRDMGDQRARNISRVVLDNYKGAYTMTQYLLNTGHRSIAIINGRMDLVLYQERFLGYCDALRAAGIEIREDLIWDEETHGEGSVYKMVIDHIRSGVRPDAIFATSDPKAWKAILAVREQNLRVPEDISVTGFDNLETSTITDPALTTMSQPLYKMGGLAVIQLINQLQNRETKEPTRMLINSKLVIRESVRKR